MRSLTGLRARSGRAVRRAEAGFGPAGGGWDRQGLASEFFDNLEPRVLLSAEYAGELVTLTQDFGQLSDVAVVDFDKDGVNDIVGVTNARFSNVADLIIAHGRAGGGFDDPQSFEFNSGTRNTYDRVRVGDFNGDGLNDVAMTRTSSVFAEVEVRYQTDGGGFRPGWEAYLGETSITGIEVADMDNDGSDDLVTGDGYGAVSILRTSDSNDRSWRGHQQFAPSGVPRDVAVADFDGDGVMDVAATHGATAFEGPWISVWRGLGNGTLESTPTSVAGVPAGYHLVAGDFNGDGRVDLASAVSKGDPTLGLHLNESSGTGSTATLAFGSRIDTELGGYLQDGETIYINDLRVGDADGNNRDDLIVSIGASFSPSGMRLVSYDANSNGTFGDETTLFETKRAYTRFAIGDVTGDGAADVVNPRGNRVEITPGRTVGGFRAPTFHDLNGFEDQLQSYSVASGDLNNDGFTDAAVAGRNNESASQDIGIVTFTINDGRGGFTASEFVIDTGSRGQQIKLADFNGDGYADLITAGNSDDQTNGTANGAVYIYLNTSAVTGSLSFGSARILDIERANWLDTGDYDRDGITDFVVAAAGSNPRLEIWHGNGDGSFGDSRTINLPAAPSMVDDADLDGDGYEDFVAMDGSGSNGYIVRGDHANEARTYQRDGSAYLGGEQAYSITTADFNGDGLVDIAASVDPSNRTTFGAGVSIILQTGEDGDDRWGDPTVMEGRNLDDATRVSAADVSGDGVPDLVGSGYGFVNVLINNGDGTFAESVPHAAGGSSVRGFAVTDFDRDRDRDILVLASGRLPSDDIPLTLLSNVAEPPELRRVDAADFTNQGVRFSIGASEFFDEDGEVVAVRFYIDLNNDGIGQANELFDRDTTAGSGAYTTVYKFEDDAELGRVTFLAIPEDDRGVIGEAVEIEVDVRYGGVVRQGGAVTGVADGKSETLAAVATPGGRLVVFEENGRTWTASDLRRETGAPLPIGDPVSYTDPKDGLSYVASPTADGLILFQRGADGEWTYRNLSEELSTTLLPQDHLVSWAGTEGTVGVAGVDDSGRLVAFIQDGRTGSEGPRWEVRNLSDDLTERGAETPEFTELIAYVTRWNTWTIAGLDASGDIQGVWVQPGQFDLWRVSNLSEINGAPRLVGGLTAILSDWNGIHIGGLDENGNTMVSWWVPSFGGEWRVSDLTRAAGAPAFVGDSLTSFYTSWGGMNYAGIDADGELMVYWWVPSGQWRVTNLTSSLSASEARPASALTSFTSPGDRSNILGAAEDGEIVRVSWQPGDAAWALENLSFEASVSSGQVSR
ncbi:MAG: VCBS repeat-containing protein [Planctomycetota bacterium]